MLPVPRADLKPNTAEFEQLPLVKPTGFRGTAFFPTDQLMGLNTIGLALALADERRSEAAVLVFGEAVDTGLPAGGASLRHRPFLSPMVTSRNSS